MTDDLLRRLAAHARQRDDRRWDERTPGPLTEAEARELGVTGSGPQADLQAAFDLPSEELVHRMITSAQQAMAAEAAPHPDEAPDTVEPRAAAPPTPADASGSDVANVRSIPPGVEAPTRPDRPANLSAQPGVYSTRRRWPAWTAGALLAAAALLTLRPAPPVWHVDEAVGTAAQRSADLTPLTLSPGGRLQLTLQPDTPTSARVEVRVALHTEAGALPLSVEVERSPAGSLRLQATLPDPLPASSGEVRVDLSAGWRGGQELRLPWTASP